MRYTILFSIFLFALLSGCSKDKFKTVPGLQFTSVNTTTLHNGELLQFTLAFTDAEGDITDSIFVQKIVADCANSNFGQLFPIPDFPSTTNQKGDLIITFGFNASPYSQVAPQCGRDETAVFRFVLRDKENHASDTISSPPITIVY